MDSVRIDERHWRHVCRKCGTVRVGHRPNYARECDRWWRGLGSRLRTLLARLGITSPKLDRALARWGISSCGCDHRREQLDRLVPWL